MFSLSDRLLKIFIRYYIQQGLQGPSRIIEQDLAPRGGVFDEG